MNLDFLLIPKICLSEIFGRFRHRECTLDFLTSKTFVKIFSLFVENFHVYSLNDKRNCAIKNSTFTLLYKQCWSSSHQFFIYIIKKVIDYGNPVIILRNANFCKKTAVSRLAWFTFISVEVKTRSNTCIIFNKTIIFYFWVQNRKIRFLNILNLLINKLL